MGAKKTWTKADSITTGAVAFAVVAYLTVSAIVDGPWSLVTFMMGAAFGALTVKDVQQFREAHRD